MNKFFVFFCVTILLSSSSTTLFAKDGGDSAMYTYTWTEGMFEGTFSVTVLDDGNVRWEALEGEYKGEHNIERVSEIAQISDDARLISWLEDSGYTITIIINTRTHKMFGIASTATKHSLLKGELKEFSLGKK